MLDKVDNPVPCDMERDYFLNKVEKGCVKLANTIKPINKRAMDAFDMYEDDYLPIQITGEIISRMIKATSITPIHLICLANFRYALDRLPEKTPGLDSFFKVSFTRDSKDYLEENYYEFHFTEEYFEISHGRYSSDRIVGEGFDKLLGRWYFQDDGYRESNLDLLSFEDSVSEFLNMGAELTVQDFSKIEMDIEETECKILFD